MEKAEVEKSLFTNPQPGIIENCYRRNAWTVRILDAAVILSSYFQNWDGIENTPYTLDKVGLVLASDDIIQGSAYDLWRIHDYHLRQKGERIDPKMHLSVFAEKTNQELFIGADYSDWSKMSMGLLLRDGLLPESLRDDILPAEYTRPDGLKGSVFSPFIGLPNHLVLHLGLITSDNHLILTARSKNLAFEQETISASAERHLDPSFEKPLDDTIDATVDKVNEQAELNLTLVHTSLRVAAMLIEPNVNNTGIIVIGKCDERATDIGPQIIGAQRKEEFQGNGSVRTLPLEEPDIWVPEFYHPQHKWHGTSRLRIIAAASYVNGYEDTLNCLAPAA